MKNPSRLHRLRETLEDEELDGILISTPENRRYVSGFAGTAGYLLVSQSDAVLATDFRYVEQAERQAPEFRIERISEPGWLPGLAREVGAKRLGFESRHMTVSAHSAFRKSIDEADGDGNLELVETSDLVDKMRAWKSPDEIEILARAIEITDEALEEVASGLELGVTEEEVAWELEKAMRERGAEAIGFDTIVGAGPNGALPHHRADGTVIADGDLVVIDMGAQYQGYCADLTRTVVVGEPDEKFWPVYNTVLEAQLAAEQEVRPGMTGKEVDALARDIIAEAGYGENFGHSLGHGVGLAVHEFPHIGSKSEDPVEDGMVFTIEPGIYLSGWGGVRIEDVVVLEKGHARVLSKASKLGNVS
jgi:Xaa-Pro aminopeptidase